jgi:hypothetical protein
MAQEKRKIVVYGAFPIVKVGVANPTGLHPDQCLAGSRIGDQYTRQLNRRSLGIGNHPGDLLRHDLLLFYAFDRLLSIYVVNLTEPLEVVHRDSIPGQTAWQGMMYQI